jgi:GTPase SAR1 family protein
LNLSDNQIQDIYFLQNLTQLQSLYLSSNQIQDISFLQNLNQLQSLDLSQNQIQDIAFLQNLNQLKSLGLSENQIQDISFLQNLNQLKSLDLRNNQIQDIAPIVPLIKKELKISWDWDYSTIIIGNNPLQTPPPEIVKEGNKAVLEYFEALEEQGSTQLYESKMLVVGEGGAGKTSLIRRLNDSSAAMPEEEETTKGIDIHDFQFETDEGNDFVINMWDFGGQEIYHATHQFFLTKRSLYILVDDTRKDDKTINDTSFRYWLEIVDLFGGDSPLLIVQNEKGDRSKDLDLNGMKARYGEMIKGRFAANLQTNRGLDDIKKEIIRQVQQLPHVGHTLPKKWAAVRSTLMELEQKGKHYISLEQFYEICEQHGMPDRKRVLWLSRYLHDLGMFLHFQEEGDTTLRKTIILNNEWATEAVYNVIDDEMVKSKKGRFTMQDIRRLWSEDSYCDMHEELIELMKRFELCYELKDIRPREFLIPQLMPVARSEYEWSSEDNLQMRYEYEFMPKGLLNRFMVRVNRHVHQPELAWRSGILLEKGDTKAEIIETYGKGEISIRVAGTQRKALMTIISDEFDELHRIYEGMKVQKLIPCNCSTCQKEDVPHFYPFSSLANRRNAGKATIECDKKPFENVNVLRLIDDVLDIPILKNKTGISEKEYETQSNHYFEEWAKGKFPSVNNHKERIAALEKAMETAVLPTLSKPVERVVVKDKKVILVLVANPKHTKALRLLDEVKLIQQSIKLAEVSDEYEVTSAGAVTIKEMRKAILKHKPVFVQFSGHGATSGELAFENKKGTSQFVKVEALGRAFKALNNCHPIDCVFLNACYSDIQAKEIVKYIPYVIGMNFAIRDESAIEFSEAFYDTIGAGHSIEIAFEMAKSAIETSDFDDEDIPVLLKRAVLE